MRAVFRSREIVPVVFALAALLGFSGAAFAHASLIRSSPPDDAVVARAPTRFDLTFSEPVSPLVLKLARPDGRVVTLDRFTLQRDTLVIEPPADLGRGTHALCPGARAARGLCRGERLRRDPIEIAQ